MLITDERYISALRIHFRQFSRELFIWYTVKFLGKRENMRLVSSFFQKF